MLGLRHPFFLAMSFATVLFGAASCFDYEERVILGAGLSGFVEIQYTVPVFANDDRSMLAFLPVDRHDIADRYSSLLRGGGRLEDYSMKMITDKDDPDAPLYPRKSRVSYRLWFKEPADLEKILIGKTSAFWRDGRLHLVRTLPAARTQVEKQGFLARRIQSYTVRSMVRKKLSFMLLVPWYYELQTTRGAFVRTPDQLGSVFQVPLETTMSSNAPVIWTIEIKPNPRPEVAPKKPAEN